MPSHPLASLLLIVSVEEFGKSANNAIQSDKNLQYEA